MKQLYILLVLALTGCSSTETSSTKSSPQTSNIKKAEASLTNKEMVNIYKWSGYVNSSITRHMGNTNQYLGLSTVVELSIERDGKVSEVKVVEKSNSQEFQRKVLEAIYASAPYNTKMLSDVEFSKVKNMKITINLQR
ncbi:TonB C-terminal domain-containing protein [Paraferrimonas sp. SM1919]|uniref:TonB C-terminal domain-containing protein n=1 Tax=Paraferrimonas sp. SM1919 TaxID=2662263 RepID=UPI0013D40F6F|nr:TonB C-terminal domain-containing protein [Paraferrimonas sp. SM1919]